MLILLVSPAINFAFHSRYGMSFSELSGITFRLAVAIL
jgi:hypothetical protein